MYIFVMYGNVGPSWNEKRIAQAIVGHICFVDVQGTPGHRCVCLVCAYYVAVCPLAAAAMAANDREWLCNIYPPPHTTRKLFSSWGNIETYNHNFIIFQISIGLSILQQRPIGTDRPNFLAKNVKSHRPVKNDIPEIHDFKWEGVTIKWDRPINVDMVRNLFFGCCSFICFLSWTLSGGSNLMIRVPELTFFTV